MVLDAFQNTQEIPSGFITFEIRRHLGSCFIEEEETNKRVCCIFPCFRIVDMMGERNVGRGER